MVVQNDHQRKLTLWMSTHMKSIHDDHPYTTFFEWSNLDDTPAFTCPSLVRHHRQTSSASYLGHISYLRLSSWRVLIYSTRARYLLQISLHAPLHWLSLLTALSCIAHILMEKEWTEWRKIPYFSFCLHRTIHPPANQISLWTSTWHHPTLPFKYIDSTLTTSILWLATWLVHNLPDSMVHQFYSSHCIKSPPWSKPFWILHPKRFLYFSEHIQFCTFLYQCPYPWRHNLLPSNQSPSTPSNHMRQLVHNLLGAIFIIFWIISIMAIFFCKFHSSSLTGLMYCAPMMMDSLSKGRGTELLVAVTNVIPYP